MKMKGENIFKAARLALLALLLEQRGPGRPKKREWDTAALASLLGVSQRSIQRDLHQAQQVRYMFRKISLGRLSQVVDSKPKNLRKEARNDSDDPRREESRHLP